MHELLYQTIARDIARERVHEADRARLASAARRVDAVPGAISRLRFRARRAAGQPEPTASRTTGTTAAADCA